MRVWERYLWLAPLLACVVVLLSAAAVAGRATELGSTTALFWWRWLLIVAAVSGLVLYLLGCLGKLATKLSVGRFVVGLAGVVVISIVLAKNSDAAMSLLRLSLRPAGLWAGLAFGLSLLAMVSVAFLGSRWRWAGRALSILALTTFAFWIAPRQHEDADGSSLPQTELTGERLLLIGIDGASWDFLDPLIASGQMPNIQGLVERGIRGDLKTLRPTRSPALWTTIVTGKRPADHGIIGHDVMHPKGDYHSLPPASAMARGFGLESLAAWLQREGQIVRSPATSVERRVPAIWNLTTAYDSPLDVINWWASWPAEAILGRIATDRTYFWRWAAKGFGDVEQAITFPETLYREVMPLLMRPDQVNLEMAQAFMAIDAVQFASMQEADYRHHEILSEFKYYYSMFESHRRITKYLLEKARAGGEVPSDLMVIFRLVDVTSHSSLQYSELVEDHLKSTAEELDRFGGVVTESYRAVDGAIGELLEVFGEGNVVLVSDHGFVAEKRKHGKIYDHRSGPPGIFLAAGPAFARGEVEGLSLFHVLPVLLALKGIPVAEDLVAEVPTTVFEPSFLAKNPVSAVETFGTLSMDRRVSESAVDEEMMERLEALGYLD